METTRERIARLLRERPMTPSELAARLDATPTTVIEHIRHVARSVEGSAEAVVVAPPSCRDCGFEDFDKPANRHRGVRTAGAKPSTSQRSKSGRREATTPPRSGSRPIFKTVAVGRASRLERR